MNITITRHPGATQVMPPPHVPDMSCNNSISYAAKPISKIDYIAASAWVKQYLIDNNLPIDNLLLDSLEDIPDKINCLRTAYEIDNKTAIYITIWDEGGEYYAIAKRITNWDSIKSKYAYNSEHVLLNGVLYYLQHTDPVRAKKLYR